MFSVPDLIDEKEALDDPNIPLEERKRLLSELDKSNLKLQIYRIVLNRFFAWLKCNFPKQKTFTVLEVGCGSGGLAREILMRAVREGVEINYHVLDILPDILEWASESLKSNNLSVTTHEAGDLHLRQFRDDQFDIVINLQMIHHLHPVQVVEDFFFQTRRIAKRGFWMADFERKRPNMIAHRIVEFVTAVDPVLSEDGAKSLRRSYTVPEILLAFAAQDGTARANWSLDVHRFWWNPFFAFTGVRR